MPLLRNLRSTLSELSRNLIAITLMFSVTSATAGSSPVARPSNADSGRTVASHSSSLSVASKESESIMGTSTTVDARPVVPALPNVERRATVEVASAARPVDSTALPEAASLPDRDTGKRTVEQPLKDPKAAEATHLLRSQAPVFIENLGQFDSRAKFQVKGSCPNAWLTEDGIVFDFTRSTQQPKESEISGVQDSSATKGLATDLPHSRPKIPGAVATEHVVVTQKLVGANPHPVMEGRNPIPSIYNYFIGPDPNKWRTHVKAFSEVVYKNIWEGIDLKLYANGKNIEEEFTVRPGADPNMVRLAYEGADSLTVSEDGSLNIRTPFGEIAEAKPNIYQETAGQRVAISGTFQLSDSATYSFDIGQHQSESELIIDPTLLYSTFLGGSSGVASVNGLGEYPTSIAVDRFGSAYVAGVTGSLDFPITPGVFQTVGNGSCPFVTKLSPLGDSLQYSTFLCGNGGATIRGIGVNSAGDAYVTGIADQTFPTTPNAYSQGVSGAFMTVLSPNGDSLIYSTGFGFGNSGNAIAVDSSGRAYITGLSSPGGCRTGSIPITPNAFQSSYSGCRVTFLGVLDPSKSGTASLIYGSYLGGSAADVGQGVAVDDYGMAYVGGTTDSQDFPVTAGAFQTTFGTGSRDAFLTKFNPYASSGPASVLYSTFLSGDVDDEGFAVAVDSMGDAFLGGVTSSPLFPTTAGALATQWDSSWGWTGFVTAFNAAGNRLVFSTYWGGNHADVYGLATDIFGNSYAAGDTRGGLIVSTNAFQPTFGGGSGFEGSFPTDAYVSKFGTQGGLISSSYLGGLYGDGAFAVATDLLGDAYVTGFTISPNFPVSQGAYQMTINPGGFEPDDAFVTKFPLGGSGVLSMTGVLPNSGGNAGSVTPTIIGTGFHGGATVTLLCGTSTVMGSNASVTGGGQAISATFDLTSSSPGTCNVVVTNPDQTSAQLAQGFTVRQGGSPDLRIQKIGTTAVPGRNMNYAITVENLGNVDGDDMVLSEYLEPWFTYIAAAPAPDSIIQLDDSFPPSADGTKYRGVLFWNTPASTLAAGADATFVYMVGLDPGFPLNFNVRGEACFTVPQCEGLRDGCLDAAAFTCSQYNNLSQRASCMRTKIDACQQSFLACMDDISLNAAHCSGATTTSVGSYDPNDLIGSTGVGLARWVAGVEPLTYALTFENLPTATAAVQRAGATNPLNMATDDLRTLKMSSMTVAGHPVPVPLTFNPLAGLNQFDTNLDLRPAKNLFVQIHAGMDPNTGLISWIFQTIDAATGQPPIDPTVGFLDPGASVSLFFTAKPKAGLPTATQISDQATITFDANQPMSTPVWINTLDNNKPTSHVTQLPTTESCPNFKVQWSGSDVGVGIKNYTIYASDNGAGFVPWLTGTNATSSDLQGAVGPQLRLLQHRQ